MSANVKPLGEWGQCPTCKRYGHQGLHVCSPAWQAILVDYHDEEAPKTVYADGDAQQVAESFADQNFGNWDYPKEMEIWVRKDEYQPWQKFEVTVEMVPSFTATEKGE
jgi:hypothetical protein